MDIDVKNLHPLEVKLLRHVSAGEDITEASIISGLGYKVGQCNQAFSWLSAKGCLEEVSRTKKTIYELTDTGRAMKEEGLPAERIYAFLKEKGPHAMPEIAEALSLEKSDVGSAFGLLSSKGALRLNEERKAEATGELPEEIDLNRARRAADEAREALLQKQSIQEYRTAQANLARAINRLRIRNSYRR